VEAAQNANAAAIPHAQLFKCNLIRFFRSKKLFALYISDAISPGELYGHLFYAEILMQIALATTFKMH